MARDPSEAVDTTDHDALAKRAEEVIAWGAFHRMLLRPLYEDEQGIYPVVAESAEGCELVDARGRRFIDWTCSSGPVVLGYHHPEVEEAITAQMHAGPLLPVMHRVELEVAEMLVEMIPCAEMVAFGKNGSDVTTAAVRIARAATGRDLVVQWGFHGFHDWFVCQYRTKNAKGIYPVLRTYLHSFDYNDLDAVERLFFRFPDEIAAVMMEPVNDVLPNPGFLEGIKELAHKNGALLIFDELVTGFRLAKGGAQEHFGVTPDIAAFGKAIANGMPLAAVVGKREYMKHLPSTAWGITYRGETLSLAAARATLGILQREPVIEHLAAMGERLRDGFRQACEERAIGGRLTGLPGRMAVIFDATGCMSAADLRTCFLLQCAANGVLTNGVLFPSYAHDEEAVDRTLEAFGRSLDTLAEVIERSRVAMREAVQAGFTETGAADAAAAGLPSGSFDCMDFTPGKLELAGWILGRQGAPDSVEVIGPNGQTFTTRPSPRPDLAKAFPDVADAATAGYQVRLPTSALAANGGHEFTVVAKRGGETLFNCRIVRGENSSSAALPDPRWTGEALHL
jgi:glutamate-1-semialdehyde 2,1-aminomutase